MADATRLKSGNGAPPAAPSPSSSSSSEDPRALELEAVAAVAAAPRAPEVPEPGAGQVPGPAEPTQEQILAGYALVCGQVVGACSNALVPNWQVTPAENQKLSSAMAQALLLWFPDQVIPPKYMALLVVAGVGFEIVAARRDPETGRFRPARLEPPRARDDTAVDPNAGDPHAPPH